MSKTKKIIKKYLNDCVLIKKKGGFYNVSKNHVLLGEWTMSLDKAESYVRQSNTIRQRTQTTL